MNWPPANPHYTGTTPAQHHTNTTLEDDGDPLEEEEPQE